MVWITEVEVEEEGFKLFLFFVFLFFVVLMKVFCFGLADDEEAGWRHPYRGGLSN